MIGCLVKKNKLTRHHVFFKLQEDETCVIA